MRVRLHPEARAELREARKWYFERSPLSATAFAHAVDNAVSQIVEAPTRYPMAEHGNPQVRSPTIPFQCILLTGRDRDHHCCRSTPEAASGLLVESHSTALVRGALGIPLVSA